jgi:ketosteroid isomerase-like protein
MSSSPGAAFSRHCLEANRELSEAFGRHFLARDFDALTRLYAEEAVLMPPGEPAVTGRPAIRSWFESLPPLAGFQVALDEIDGREDLAYVRGTYSMTFGEPGGASQVPLEGKFLEIRKRQPDGSWLLVADMFNSDRP